MAKLVVFLLGFGIIGGAAYYYLQGAKARSSEEASEPKRQLDNVREAAGRIEDDAQKRANELLERTQ